MVFPPLIGSRRQFVGSILHRSNKIFISNNNKYEKHRLCTKLINSISSKRTLVATRIIDSKSHNNTKYDDTTDSLTNSSKIIYSKQPSDEHYQQRYEVFGGGRPSPKNVSLSSTTGSSSVVNTANSTIQARTLQQEGNPTSTIPPPTPNSSTTPPGSPNKTNLMDGTVAYETKSIAELIRAMTVFTVLQYTPSVVIKNAERILHYVQHYVLGTRLTNIVLRYTLFNQFCAGENEATIQQPIHQLQQAGIGCILDYAAEATTINSSPNKDNDTKTTNTSSLSSSSSSDPTTDAEAIEQESGSNFITMVRTYDYESERVCDNHTSNFQKCIEDAAVIAASMPLPSSSTSTTTMINPIGTDEYQHHPPLPPYAAIKITALGNPLLLKRLSVAIQEIHQFFQKLDTNQDGYITLDDFQHGLDQHFHPSYHPIFQERIQYLFASNNDDNDTTLDTSSNNTKGTYINYETFTQFFTLDDLPALTAGCKVAGPLQMATPTAEEIQLLHALRDRVHKLADVASSNGTRLLIDAEQSWYQPAIDNIVFELQRIYNHPTNSPYPIVYNTYQMYLKDSLYRLQNDYHRSFQYQYHFGAKLVRGAYMEQERAVAAAAGIPSPIHDTFHDTDTNYNTALEYILRHYHQYQQEQVQQHNNNDTTQDPSIPLQTEIMCATHNTESIELAVRCMNELGIVPTSQTVSFAQLYGMMDPVTYNLGYDGYRAYKYVPYGEIQMVIPYLLRRAAENSAIASTTTSNREIYMVRQEIQRRIFRRR